MADRQASFDLAARAGLRWVNDETPGHRRIRRGKGFSYVDQDGQTVSDDDRRWIESLVIPPAWTDVWISTDRRGHLLATGKDDAGRKQYIYHPDWEEARDAAKFDRMGEFAERLPVLRQRVEEDLGGTGLAKDKVIALSVAILDRTLIRVGSRQYAEANDSYGLTTLTPDHVRVGAGRVVFSFTGKGGIDQEVVLSDGKLARLVGQSIDLGGETVLGYLTDGGVTAVSPEDVNQYLAERAGEDFTAKDFRTWGATAIVVGELAQASPSDLSPDKQFLSAIDIAADRLGNTRDVCRTSYVHPIVEAALEDGTLTSIWKRSRKGRWTSRSESATRKLLES